MIGESGAGAVKVTATAQHRIKNIDIDPEILKESKDIVEELIVAAMNNAMEKAAEVSKSAMPNPADLLSGANLTDDDKDA